MKKFLNLFAAFLLFLASFECLARYEWLNAIPSVDPQNSPRAVVIVAHGLNLKPSAMDEVIRELEMRGADVLRLILKGHDGSAEALKTVTAQEWLTDFQEAYDAARIRADQAKVPLYFVGYSLGATVGERFLTSSKKSFDRAVLFAPALSFKWHMNLIRAAKFVFSPKLVIPSANFRKYRANLNGTPLAAYHALLDLQEGWIKAEAAGANIPTLVVIDPEDELVNYEGLLGITNKFQLKNWQFFRVQNHESRVPNVPHHLIINSEVLGARQWGLVLQQLRAHFGL